jgi:hypothetical protein
MKLSRLLTNSATMRNMFLTTAPRSAMEQAKPAPDKISSRPPPPPPRTQTADQLHKPVEPTPSVHPEGSRPENRTETLDAVDLANMGFRYVDRDRRLPQAPRRAKPQGPFQEEPAPAADPSRISLDTTECSLADLVRRQAARREAAEKPSSRPPPPSQRRPPQMPQPPRSPARQPSQPPASETTLDITLEAKSMPPSEPPEPERPKRRHEETQIGESLAELVEAANRRGGEQTRQ